MSSNAKGPLGLHRLWQLNDLLKLPSPVDQLAFNRTLASGLLDRMSGQQVKPAKSQHQEAPASPCTILTH